MVGGLHHDESMVRAILLAFGLALLLLWLVGLVDHATWWMAWLDGITALAAIGLAALVTKDSGPITTAIGPALLGTALLALFIVGIATRSSAWIVWFNLAYAVGLLSFAALAFTARSLEVQPHSRRTISEQ
jgi:hypothetical protein